MTNGQHNENRRKALKEKAAKDYYRLTYHVMPEGGWMNDPNGLIQFRGQYHVFFQHYPYATSWGPMHWGHVVSDDLLHWNYLPIALSPDQPYEKGCYSGSAVENHGELTLVYTAHDDSRSPKEVQCIATSRDGVTFEKYSGNPVIACPPEGMEEDFRDPKVFCAGGKWHMVVGCSGRSLGSIAMYVSEDLRHWEYKGIICQSNGEQGTMWECPDLFHLDGADILMCSPINMKGTRTMFLTGKMDYKGYHFTPKCCDKVDYGPEFYAPQTFLDSRGRRILIGWMATWGEKIPTGKNGWAGALTLPRELFLEDGRVCQRPVREISSLRRETLHQGSIQLKDDQHGNLSSVASDCMEIKISARENSARRKTCGRLDFILRASADFGECTVVSYDFERQELTVDTRNSGQGRKGRTVVKVPLKEGSLKIQMFVDRSSLEIFCGGGRYVISTRIFPQENSLYCDLVSKGSDITVESLEIYRL